MNVNIKELAAGPELDALVADKVMDYKAWAFGCPRYSTEITAAWTIVLKYSNWNWSISRYPNIEEGMWMATVSREVAIGERSCIRTSFVVYAETVELLICRSALVIAEELAKIPKAEAK